MEGLEDKTRAKQSMFTTLGASNHAKHDREENDYYATDPVAIMELMKHEQFAQNIWEPCCGEGHLSKELENAGYDVISTDLIDRGYGLGGIDFLKTKKNFAGDIVTNPPYKMAEEFVRHCMMTIEDGNRVAMFLRIQFLEGQKRRELFGDYKPEKVYVSSKRILCAMNGAFDEIKGSAACYCWIIWKKGYTGPTELKWFN